MFSGANTGLMAGLVQRERRLQPRLGTRKLYHLLKPELDEAGVRMGRDRMFEELRLRDLLLEPVAAAYPRTTQPITLCRYLGIWLRSCQSKRPMRCG